MADCDNITVVHSDVLQSFQKLSNTVEKIVERGSFPVIHSITFPVVRGLSKFEPLDIAHFDAHMDYSHETQGVLYMNGSPICRCRELSFVPNVSSNRIRKEQKKLYDEAVADGNLIVTTNRFHSLGCEAAMDLIAESENLYITLDIDVMDHTHAPGTGTTASGGLVYEEPLEALVQLAKNHRIVAFHVVEVTPPYDTIWPISPRWRHPS